MGTAREKKREFISGLDPFNDETHTHPLARDRRSREVVQEPESHLSEIEREEVDRHFQDVAKSSLI